MFPDSNSKTVCPFEFKLDREIDHHHIPFEIGEIPSFHLSVFCPFVCPYICLSTFLFPDSNSKTVCPIEFKLDREIDHHHIPFEIGEIPSFHLSVFCPFVCPYICLSTFLFPDSNSKTVCPIDFKLDREIDHHHIPFEIGEIPSFYLSVFCPFVCPYICLSTFLFPDSNSKTVCPIEFILDRNIDPHHS